MRQYKCPNNDPSQGCSIRGKGRFAKPDPTLDLILELVLDLIGFEKTCSKLDCASMDSGCSSRRRQWWLTESNFCSKFYYSPYLFFFFPFSFTAVVSIG